MCLSTAKDYDYVIKAKARNFLVTSWLRRLFGAQSSSDLSISVGWSGSCVDFAEDLHTSIVCVCVGGIWTYENMGSWWLLCDLVRLSWSDLVCVCESMSTCVCHAICDTIYLHNLWIYDTYEYPHVLFMIVSLLFPSIPVMYNHEPSSK